MARKVREPLDPALSIHDMPKQEPIQAPTQDAPRKRGRPSKVEVEARKEAVKLEAQMKPEEMLPITVVILRFISKGIKGDAPSKEEIELVNGPACAVANKYSFSTKWAPELALMGALLIVGSQMRMRAQEKVEREKRNRRDSGAEGIGKNAPSSVASPEAVQEHRL